MKCFQRSGKTNISGCSAGGAGDVSGYDYCYNPGFPELVNKGVSGCTAAKRCDECEGDCDSDSDCMHGLKWPPGTVDTRLREGAGIQQTCEYNKRVCFV